MPWSPEERARRQYGDVKPGKLRPAHLTVLKVAILAVNLSVGGLGALGAWSVLYALEIELPAREDIWPHVEGSSLVLTSNATVRNRGFFDVDDVTVSVKAETANGSGSAATLLDYSKSVGTIGKGETPLRVDIPITFTDLKRYSWLLYSDTQIRLTVSVTALYLYKLIDFKAIHLYENKWERLVYDIKPDFANTTYDYPQPDTIRLRIPFEALLNPLLQGILVDSEAEVYNDLGLIGDTKKLIALDGPMESRRINGTYYEVMVVRDYVDVVFSRETSTDLMTRSQPLRIVITGIVAGQKGSLEYPYKWWAPLAGLTITTSGSPTSFNAVYEFTNEAPADLPLKISLDFYDVADNRLTGTQRTRTVPGCAAPPAGCVHVIDSIGWSDPSIASAKRARVLFEDLDNGMRYEANYDLNLLAAGARS